ncbi:hypothetical protein [Pseudoduganella lutea]|uniref:hypothetical protein n=1 Tax=Pseudoduganella lutea TaxID=321985 RepID=UPI001E489740|nr:hypothetical protein [Pseudoduganella lutea]
MSDWSAGYVSDIGYTYGVYSELNPLRVRLAFLHAGLMFPGQGYSCELGFGQGVSVNVHAAASGTQWHGTDFNPAQAGFARDLAAASGADVHLSDASFADFCARPTCPISISSACMACGAGCRTRTAACWWTSCGAS